MQPLLIELDIGQLFDIQIDIKYNHNYIRQSLTNIKYFNAYTYVVRKVNIFVNYLQNIKLFLFKLKQTLAYYLYIKTYNYHHRKPANLI